jgi:hypothetical protein
LPWCDAAQHTRHRFQSGSDGDRPGLVDGLAASLAATRIIRSYLYGITATDPATFTVVVLTLFAVACLACNYPPAAR